MIRARSVMVMRHQQSSSKAHARLVKIARAFAKKEKLGSPVPATDATGVELGPAADFSVAPVLFWVRMAEEDHAKIDALVASFGSKANVTVLRHATPDEADYRKASYLTLWGAGLEDAVFVNADEAFTATAPCRCGGIDRQQVADILVDAKAVSGWDVLNTPSGGIIVSRRVAKTIAERRFRGIATRPVRDAKTKRPIAMVQLVAKRTALLPCRRHDASGICFCAGCGRGLGGEPRGLTSFAPKTTGGADLLSSYPHPHAYLYASRRFRAALVAMGAKGLAAPTDLLNVCAHPAKRRS